MSQSKFEAPISIKSAIDYIQDNTFLLPGIQRKFTWNVNQIEMLFDSIMRDYPINSFMFWEVRDEKIKNEQPFYSFLSTFRERFKEENEKVDTKGYKDFKAIIDGQQRLTALFLGLKGSYAYKLYRLRYNDDEYSIPTRHLYLNLKSTLIPTDDSPKMYDFRFITKAEHDKMHGNENNYWYAVGDILKLREREDVYDFVNDETLISDKRNARKMLDKLYSVILERPLINYYLEREQTMDKVLDVFIRTNSGGTRLSFSDLLMSITTAKWTTLEPRQVLPKLVNEVFHEGFLINQDFLLKTCLVLFADDVRFKIKNFTYENIKTFEDNWELIHKSTIEGFKLVKSFGFSEENLRSKNIVIPIIYYIYHKEIAETVNIKTRHQEEKRTIQKWLNISLLKSIFSGQSDAILKGIRDSIKTNIDLEGFPLDSIRERFKSSPSKNLSFDDEFIETLLTTQIEDREAFYILSLLYPNLNYFDQDFHKDHIHPASYFRHLINEPEIYRKGISDEDYQFYTDSANWNSILNLQLLNGYENGEKSDKPLELWVAKNNIDLQSHLIPNTVNLNINGFKAFIDARKALLTEKIKALIFEPLRTLALME